MEWLIAFSGFMLILVAVLMWMVYKLFDKLDLMGDRIKVLDNMVQDIKKKVGS